jgi:ABC-type branched-subunit amino acid transport system substrate-binding protein/uncharacterized membrane protein YgcG
VIWEELGQTQERSLPLPVVAAAVMILLVAHLMMMGVAEVNIGAMFPLFRTDASRDLSGARRLAAFTMAIAEINNKSDGVADSLLPGTSLKVAFYDSSRDVATSIAAALALPTAFGGLGVSAIVGPASSGPSMSVAIATGGSIPQIAYSATSSRLSDGLSYPSFLRVVPSDAFQAVVLVDLIRERFGISRVATVSSTDAYSVDLLTEFLSHSSGAGGADGGANAPLSVLASVRFTAGTTDFSAPVEQLRASDARAIILLCSANDAGRLMTSAFNAGIGGEGFLWIGSDGACGKQALSPLPPVFLPMCHLLTIHFASLLCTASTKSDTYLSSEPLASNATLRELVMKGFVGVVPRMGAGEAYDAFLARLAKLPATSDAGGGTCDPATDDNGATIHARDHDLNASTPLECAGIDSGADVSLDAYAAYTYDAVYALAHALHQLLEVQGVVTIEASELLDALHSVSFVGATGTVEFYTATTHDQLYHGDRRSGLAYDVLNYASDSLGFVRIATWTPCGGNASAGSVELLASSCAFSERWAPSNAFNVTFSTADNSRIIGGKIGLLQYATTDFAWQGIACAGMLAVKHANARDGSVVPELAANSRGFHISAVMRDHGSSAVGAIHAFQQVGAVDGILLTSYSSVSHTVARLGSIERTPQISTWSSSPALSGAYSHFSRTWPSDELAANVLMHLIHNFGWRKVGIVHIDTDYANGYVRQLQRYPSLSEVVPVSFQAEFEAAGADDPLSAHSAVQFLKDKGLNIIIGIVYDLEPTLAAAEALGMLDEGYAWIFTDGPGTIPFYNTADPARARRQLHGLLSFQASPRFTPGFARLTEVWDDATPADCANDLFEVPSNIFEQPLNDVAAHVYDGVAALALALGRSERSHDGDEVITSLRESTFDGATGPVAFETEADLAGDRAPSGAVYTLENIIVNTSDPRVWSSRIVKTVSTGNTDGAANITNVPGEQIFWPGVADDNVAIPVDRTTLIDNRLAEIVVYVLLGLIVVVGIVRMTRYALRVLADRRKLMESKAARCRLAQAASNTCDFPFCVVSLSAFLKHGKLHKHEDCRDANEIVFLDTPERVQVFTAEHSIVFFSHQWLAYDEPDPNGVHYRAMVRAAKTLCKDTGVAESDLYLWVDYSSVPQENKAQQAAAIRSIALYAKACEFFIIVAPVTVHASSGAECNMKTYQRRGWCRLEQWARMSNTDLGSMYMFNEEGGGGSGGGGSGGGGSGGGGSGGRVDATANLPEPTVPPAPAAAMTTPNESLVSLETKGSEFLNESICIFEGDFTCEADKEMLIDVVMGLWAGTLLRGWEKLLASHGEAGVPAAFAACQDADMSPEASFTKARRSSRSPSSPSGRTLRRSGTRRVPRGIVEAVRVNNATIVTLVEAVKERVFPTVYFGDMISILEAQLLEGAISRSHGILENVLDKGTASGRILLSMATSSSKVVSRKQGSSSKEASQIPSPVDLPGNSKVCSKV